MIISDYTVPELDFFRRTCNFVGHEEIIFEYRSKGMSLDIIAEKVNMSVDGVKKISRKVNKKIIRAAGGKDYDKRGSNPILEESL